MGEVLFSCKQSNLQRRAVRPGREAHDLLEFLGKVHIVGIAALLGDLSQGHGVAVELQQEAGVTNAHIGEEPTGVLPVMRLKWARI